MRWNTRTGNWVEELNLRITASAGIIYIDEIDKIARKSEATTHG